MSFNHNDIYLLQERKNGQINTLMKNHEKAFSDIKNYYNDITLNNLALINTLKDQVGVVVKLFIYFTLGPKLCPVNTEG